MQQNIAEAVFTVVEKEVVEETEETES
jgi:hypothetical protein